jgi:probable HAF family extracellular repeat protein
MFRTALRRLSLACTLAASAATTHAAPLYSVTDLGNFFATGVNDSGWVTGYDSRALVYRPGSGIQQIVGPTDCAAGCTTRANAINNSGQIAGYVWFTNFASVRAILWSETGGVVDMGDLPQGNNLSRGNAINDQGWVGGTASGQYSGHPRFGNQSYLHATVHVTPDNVIELEDPPGGTQSSEVRGLNNAGVAVGQAVAAGAGGNGPSAMVWDGGGLLDLGALWGVAETGAGSSAWDVNNLGQVVLELPLAGGGTTAGLWQPGPGFLDLGRLPGASTARATAINDAGVAVGWAGVFGVSGTRAFRWDAGEGMLDLNDLLNAGIDDDWLILEANAISESGLIAGRGFHPDLGFRAILLTPVPLPATSWLLLGGLLTLSGIARRIPRRDLRTGSIVVTGPATGPG